MAKTTTPKKMRSPQSSVKLTPNEKQVLKARALITMMSPERVAKGLCSPQDEMKYKEAKALIAKTGEGGRSGTSSKSKVTNSPPPGRSVCVGSPSPLRKSCSAEKNRMSAKLMDAPKDLVWEDEDDDVDHCSTSTGQKLFYQYVVCDEDQANPMLRNWKKFWTDKALFYSVCYGCLSTITNLVLVFAIILYFILTKS